MGVYPLSIRRCKHIKVDGTQCGSPALRDKTFCHFHERWDQDGMSHVVRYKKDEPVKLPALEDANSVQVWLAEVMRIAIRCPDCTAGSPYCCGGPELTER